MHISGRRSGSNRDDSNGQSSEADYTDKLPVPISREDGIPLWKQVITPDIHRHQQRNLEQYGQSHWSCSPLIILWDEADQPAPAFPPESQS